MNISVFGLGYVGMVNIACLADLGHHMIGCDIKQQKVNILKKGESTVLEPGVDERIRVAFETGRLEAYTDAKTCVAKSDMALICVGTPSDAEGNVNLSYIRNTAAELSEVLKETDKPYTIIFRSTIPPGTIEEEILPAIASRFPEYATRVKVAFLPEFLREGNAVKDFFTCSRIIAGVDADKSAEAAITEVFGFSNEIPLFFTDYRTAEFVKYVDNAYHAAKVAFANELYSIGSRMGVNVSQANELFLADDILNISTKYLRPGMPYGGSCLPKDTRALLHFGKLAEIETPFLEGVAASNTSHKQRIAETVLREKGQRVLIFGLTFKQNTDDIRESPFVDLLGELIARGRDVRVYDEKLNMTALRIEHPHLVQYIYSNLDECANWADLIVLNEHRYEPLQQLCTPQQRVINCLNDQAIHFNGAELRFLY